MKRSSLVEHGHTLAQKISWRLALISSSFLIIALSALYVFYANSSVNNTFNSQIKNFTYWTQVGDQFQIKRALSHYEDLHTSRKIRLKTRMGEKSFGAPSNLKVLGPIYFKEGRFFFEKSQPLIASDGQNLGEMTVINELPLYLFAFAFFLFLVVIKFLSQYFLKKFSKFGNTIVAPIQELGKEIEEAQRLDLLSDLGEDEENFLEIQKLRNQIKNMAARISEQEKQIQIQERLEYREELTNQIAHDIRSPLAVIESVLESPQELVSEESRELLTLATDRVRAIAQELIDREKRSIHGNNLCDIESLIDDSIKEKEHEVSVNDRPIKIFKTDKFVTTKIKVDSQDLKRVLSNLYNNSIEALRDSSINEPMIMLSSEIKMDSIVISVVDNGPGIPENVQEKLFTKNFTYGKTNGTGLGLYGAKKIIQKFGGDITIRSQEGLGTMVNITLPLPAQSITHMHNQKVPGTF